MTDEIINLIKARYPVVWVLSYEEDRAIEHLKTVTDTLNYSMFLWSSTKGLYKFDTIVDRDAGTNEETIRVVEKQVNGIFQPMEILDHIIKSQLPNSIYVLLDIGWAMQDPIVQRKFRDTVSDLRKKTVSVVLLSSQLELPVQLRKEISVVDFNLPNQKEVGDYFDMVNAKVGAKLENGEREKLIKSLLGLTQFEVENVLAKSLAEAGTFKIDAVLSEKAQVVRKSGILEYYQPEDMGNVGGLDIMKKWVTQRQAAFTDKAKEYGLSMPKGMLLIGVQGCGKSLSAKAIASLWKMPLLKLDMGKMFHSLVGSSEANIREALKVADAIAPCVLWIDELDKSASGTESSGRTDSGTTGRVIMTLLTWLQEKTSPVFVVATANDPTKLPAALLRKGRFDELFFVDLPNQLERTEILKIHIKKRKRDDAKFDLTKVVNITEGFSGAELEELVNAAMFRAFGETREFTTDDMVKEAEATIPLSKTMEIEINALREWAKPRCRPATSPIVTTGSQTSRFERR